MTLRSQRLCLWSSGRRSTSALIGTGRCDVESNTGSYRQTAQLFRLLSHPARVRILDALRRRDEACVCHLQAVLKQRQPYVSQQSGILRDAGLVDSRRDGLYIYYRLSDSKVVQVLDTILGPTSEPRHPTECACLECQQARKEQTINLTRDRRMQSDAATW